MFCSPPPSIEWMFYLVTLNKGKLMIFKNGDANKNADKCLYIFENLLHPL